MSNHLPESSRDDALRRPVQDFLDGSLSAVDLDASLREFAKQFEIKPYRMQVGTGGQASIEWNKVPKDRLMSLMLVIVPIRRPIEYAFLSGQLTPAAAAVKLAPFYLMFPGFGMDVPPEADAAVHQRRDELLLELRAFAAGSQ